MSEWTKTPTTTGAYWFQIPSSEPDIVWVHQDRSWGLIGGWRLIKDEAIYGGMFYGPLDLPPPMPGVALDQ